MPRFFISDLDFYKFVITYPKILFLMKMNLDTCTEQELCYPKFRQRQHETSNSIFLKHLRSLVHYIFVHVRND